MYDVITVDCQCCPSDRCVLLVPAAIELRFMPDPPTLNIHGVHRMNKSDDLELTCRYEFICVRGSTQTYSYIVVFTRQGSAVPEMDDPSDKRSLLHCRLQRTGPLLYDAAHLQRHCERDGPVPVLLQGPESGGRQDVGGDLCVRPRYNSVYLYFLHFSLLLSTCRGKNATLEKVLQPVLKDQPGGLLPLSESLLKCKIWPK